MRLSQRPLYFVLLSTVAGAILVAIFLASTGSRGPASHSDLVLVSGTFIASCLLCMSMTISPNWVGRAIGRPTTISSAGESEDKARGRRGHHPDCAAFDSHRISAGHLVLCSGCVGLAIGASVSIVLMIAYASLAGNVPRDIQAAFLAGGFGAIALSFVESSIKTRVASLHVFVNGFMIVGFFLLVTAMFAKAGLVPGLIAVLFSYLWIDARIELSLRRHTLICAECPDRCKMY